MGSLRQIAVFLLIFSMNTAFTGRIWAQTEPLRVKYNFYIDDGDRAGSKLDIEKDGKRWKQNDGATTKGYIDLDYQHEYVLKFSKPGFITKMIAVSTKVPKDMLKDGFEPLLFDVTIFRQYDGVNIVVFTQPVAKYDYRADKDDFGYDTDYNKQILSDVKKAEDELKLKHKEDKNFADKANARANPPAKKPDDETAGKKGKEGDPVNDDGTNKKAKEGDPGPDEKTGKKAKEGDGKQIVAKTDDTPRLMLNPRTEDADRNSITARTEDSDKRRANLKSRTEYDSQAGGIAALMADNHIEREYIEGNRRVTETTVVRNGRTFVYKKIVYVWGVYYFRDGVNITQPSYIQEAL